VEQRSGDEPLLARAKRDLREQGRGRIHCVRLLALGALRRAGRTRGEDHDAALLLRRDQVGGVTALDERLDGRVLHLAGVVLPGDEALAPLTGVLQQPVELLVEDQRLRLLALHHVGELGAGEGRVEQQGVRAELRERHHRLDEVAVVAHHQAHVVALVDALVGERVRERVRALVHLLEGDVAELVDDRVLVGIEQRGALVAGGGRRAPAPQRRERARQLVRPVQPQETRARENLRAPEALRDRLHHTGILSHLRPPESPAFEIRC
jgi:hypothetical protein